MNGPVRGGRSHDVVHDKNGWLQEQDAAQEHAWFGWPAGVRRRLQHAGCVADRVEELGVLFERDNAGVVRKRSAGQ